MDFSALPLVGPVSFLQFSSSGSLVFVGIGSTVHVYDVASGVQCMRKTVLDASSTVHGVDARKWIGFPSIHCDKLSAANI
jgi:hypothetical protein